MACRPFDPFKLDARVCVRNGQVCLIVQGRVAGPGGEANDAMMDPKNWTTG
jgi:hypothetical protein